MTMTSSLQSLLKQKISENIQAHNIADKTFNEFDVYQLNKLEKIELDKIRPNSAQPRLQFDDSSIDELAQSIHEIGLLQPINVRKIDDHFEIIAGERRFRACQKLGKNSIDCIIVNVNEENNVLLALAENLSRENLSDYEIAKSIIAFKSSFPSKTEYAKALGISRQKLYKLFSYEILPKEILVKLDEFPSLISSDVAEQLATFKKQSPILDTEFNNLLSQGFELIVNNKLKQTKLIDYLRSQMQARPNSDSLLRNAIKKTYKKDGKPIGKIKQTDKKYIVELDNIVLSQSDFEKIEAFFDNLFTSKHAE